MTKVSVILPVYNVGRYLDETFASLLGQTLREIEIIVVNDGSTDNSEEIIKKYAAADKRIRLISQENKGQAAARNVGLGVATGIYVYFMDADDTISPEALETCFRYAILRDADICAFDGDIVYEEGARPISWDYKQCRFMRENRLYYCREWIEDMLSHDRFNSVVWLYLISKRLLYLSGVKFHEGIIHEDELFTVRAFMETKRVVCLQKSFVQHRIRSGSTMGSGFTKRNIDCYITVASEILYRNSCSTTRKYLRFMLPKVFYTAHQIPLKQKFGVFARATIKGLLWYIGLKSILVFWFKRKRERC